MAETFTYDLTSFLRVLYRRRGMIALGTILVTLVVAFASLIWPQTWRADAKVLVTTPKFKEKLQLIPKQFDVLTYRGIMTQVSLYQEILSTLKWYNQAIESLLQNEPVERMEENLPGKAERLTHFQLIENTNIPLMTTLLEEYGPEPQVDEELLETRIYMLAHLSDEQIKELYEMSESELDDITVFDLRKWLSATVEVIKETNLETIYSHMIEVSAEFGTADGSQMLANTWIGLFEHRAEEVLRDEVDRQIRLTRDSAANLRIELASAESELASLQSEAEVDKLRAQAASLLIQLTGVSPLHQRIRQKSQSFDLEDENEPFMRRQLEEDFHLSFEVTPQFGKALIPKKQRLTEEIASLEAMKEAMEDDQVNDRESIQNQLTKAKSQLKAIDAQIKDLSHQWTELMKTIANHKTEITELERTIQQKRAALNELQPLLSEADLLGSRPGDTHFRDVSVGRAIKPDKRVFPKRSLMTLAGALVGFFLFCGLAFFLDIWKAVTEPETQHSAREDTVSSKNEPRRSGNKNRKS